jgi:hypothetical protein
MFNLLVSHDGLAWETDQVMSTPLSRFKEYSGSESERVFVDKPETLAYLESVDTLLMYETGTDGPNPDVVRVGRVRDIRPGKVNITFRFKETGRVPRAVVEQYGSLANLGTHELNRTHWAIKDGSLHKLIRDQVVPTQERYDVALSFAGEDRDYVQGVADYLAKNGVAVFYDKFEEVELWGKDLVEHLDFVYRTGAQYCVMFISEHYARKIWTNHERRSALAAALVARKEYILPVKFDSTEIPGLRPTVGYISLTDKTPEELGLLILRKLGR